MTTNSNATKTAFAAVCAARKAAVTAMGGADRAAAKSYGAWIAYAEALNAYLPIDVMEGNTLAHWFDLGTDAKNRPQISDSSLVTMINSERQILCKAAEQFRDKDGLRKLWKDIKGYARAAAERDGKVSKLEAAPPAKDKAKKGADDKKSEATKASDKAKGLQGALAQITNWLTQMAATDEADIAPTPDMEAAMDKIATLWTEYRKA